MAKKQTLFGAFILLALGIILYTVYFPRDSDESDIGFIIPKNEQSPIAPSEPLIPSDALEKIEQNLVVNKIGETIEKRYNPPIGFTRVSVEKDSFGIFLRNQKLKPYGAQVLYYNGKSKNAV